MKSKIFTVTTLIIAAVLMVVVTLTQQNASSSISEGFKRLDRETRPATKPVSKEPVSKEPVSEPTPVVLDKIPDEVIAELGARYDAHVRILADTIRNAFHQMSNQLNQITDDYSRQSKETMQHQVETVITRTALFRLIALSAEDMIRRDDVNREGQWVYDNLIQPLEPATARFQTESQNAIARFQQTLENAVADFEAAIYGDLARVAADPKWDPAVGALISKHIEGNIGGWTTWTRVALPTILIPADAIALMPKNRAAMTRVIDQAIRTAYRHALRTPLMPLVKKAGAAAAAVVADGPLPIGDVIAVGFAGWTAWDLYWMATNCQEDMMKGFSSGLAEINNSLKSDTLKPLEQELKKQIQHARNMKAGYLASLRE